MTTSARDRHDLRSSGKPARGSRGEASSSAKHDHHDGDTAVVVRSVVTTSIAVSDGIRIERAFVLIGARPAGAVPVSKVADVRDSPAGAVIDFGRMRTVSDLEGPTQDVLAWVGAAYATEATMTSTVAFKEVMTERLLVKQTSAADARAFTVTVPGAPADLEVTVAGRRVFFQSGEVKRAAIGTTAGPSDYFVAKVDVTDAVLASRPGPDGTVAVELRAATAGVLSLTTQVTRTRVHDVAFPEGDARVVTFAAEDAATLALPVPAGAPSWLVSAVAMKVSAKLDELRVTPAIGPALSTAAELVLDGDHPVALQITAGELAGFGVIAGVRVWVAVDAAGAELGAVLLADQGGSPGDPIAGGDLVSTPLAAGSGWQTLVLRRPLPLTGAPLWLALQVAHGRAIMKLGATTGGIIKRGRPGGAWHGFSTGVAVTPRAALRIVGTAGESDPLFALTAALGAGPAVDALPTADGTTVELTVPTPIHPTTTLPINLTAFAPGAYRFSDVQVFYRLAGDA